MSAIFWLALVAAVVNFAVSQPDTCIVGTAFEESGSMTPEFESHDSLLLLQDVPANCNGTARAYHFCFFYQIVFFPIEAILSIAVYRPTHSGYVMVEDSLAIIEINSNQYSQGFHCKSQELSPFDVQEGDLVGACASDPWNEITISGFELLEVAATPNSPQDLYHLGTSGCDIENIPRRVDRDAVTQVSSNGTINLYLEVDVNLESSSTAVVSTTVAFPYLYPSLPGNTPIEAVSPTHVTDQLPVLTPSVDNSQTITAELEPRQHSSLMPSVQTGNTAHEMETATMSGIPYSITSPVLAAQPTVQSTPTPSHRNITRLTHENGSSSTDSSTILEILTIVLSVALTVTLLAVTASACTVLACYSIRRKRQTRRSGIAVDDIGTQNTELPEIRVPGIYNGTSDIDGERGPYVTPAETEEGLYAQLEHQRLEMIPRKAIEVHLPIGHGHYGVIDQGYWHSSSENGGEVEYEVAIKSIRSGKDERVQLLREAAIMSQFHHPNILKLHGIVAESEMVMLVLEIAHGGDLKKYIRSLGVGPDALEETSLKCQLVSFSKDIAAGMAYLSRKGFIHRNLAARNVLLSSSRVCKIGDFRMSRDLVESPYYRLSQGARIPVKWTAPEAVLHQKYSTASDVWSYGCVLYEIWSLGKDPFDKLTIPEVIDRMKQEYRHPPPPGSPSVIPEMLMGCWQKDPHIRPNFEELMKLIARSPEFQLMKASNAGALTNYGGSQTEYYNTRHQFLKLPS